MCDKLDPGAGYWIHMPADLEQYSYAPSTGCPTAFWDLICGGSQKYLNTVEVKKYKNEY